MNRRRSGRVTAGRPYTPPSAPGQSPCVPHGREDRSPSVMCIRRPSLHPVNRSSARPTSVPSPHRAWRARRAPCRRVLADRAVNRGHGARGASAAPCRPRLSIPTVSPDGDCSWSPRLPTPGAASRTRRAAIRCGGNAPGRHRSGRGPALPAVPEPRQRLDEQFLVAVLLQQRQPDVGTQLQLALRDVDTVQGVETGQQFGA